MCHYYKNYDPYSCIIYSFSINFYFELAMQYWVEQYHEYCFNQFIADPIKEILKQKLLRSAGFQLNTECEIWNLNGISKF